MPEQQPSYPPAPPYSTLPPPPPMPMAGPPGPQRPRRWWPVAGVTGFVGVVIGAVVASIVSAGTAGDRISSAPTTVTVTAQPAPPPTPAPLPTADADRATCDSWVEVAKLTREASEAQGVIPKGLSILDAKSQDNPEWKAGVMKAADDYAKAADVVDIAPGSTSLLAQTAEVAQASFRALSTAYMTFDRASGNVYTTTKEAADSVDALCGRLAPR